MNYESFNRAWLSLCLGNNRPQISMHPDTFQAEWRKFCNYLDAGRERADHPAGAVVAAVMPDNPPYISFKGVDIRFDKNLLHGVVRLEQVAMLRELPVDAYRDAMGSVSVEAFDIRRLKIDLSIMPIGVAGFEHEQCRSNTCGQEEWRNNPKGTTRYPKQAIWKLKDGKSGQVLAAMNLQIKVEDFKDLRDLANPAKTQATPYYRFLCQCCFTGNYEAYERVNAAGAKFGELEVWEDLAQYSPSQHQYPRSDIVTRPTATFVGWEWDKHNKQFAWMELEGGHIGHKFQVVLEEPRQEPGSFGGDYWAWDKIWVDPPIATDGPKTTYFVNLNAEGWRKWEFKTESGWLEDAYLDAIREALKE